MRSIFWTAYSSGDRHYVINTIKESVVGYGDIVDFNFFSDISIVLTIEIADCNINGLYKQLKQHMQLDDYDLLNSLSKKERIIFLNITFTNSTGNLKVETPFA